MRLGEIPSNIGAATEEGINDAYEAVVEDDQSAQAVAELLTRNPREVIRRAIRLNRYQRAALIEMDDSELQELVAPVVEALGQPDPLGVRLHFVERVETQSPMRIKCSIEYES